MQPVESGIIKPAHRQGWTELVAFAGMVENHGEDDGDPCVMQRVDCGAHLRPAARREARIGCAHRNWIVSPIVAEPERRQMPLVDPRRDRQKLDGGRP